MREGASYPVRLATAHPIHENCRVRHFRRLLTAPPGPDADEQLALLGELMFQARMRTWATAAACLKQMQHSSTHMPDGLVEGFRGASDVFDSPILPAQAQKSGPSTR